MYDYKMEQMIIMGDILEEVHNELLAEAEAKAKLKMQLKAKLRTEVEAELKAEMEADKAAEEFRYNYIHNLMEQGGLSCDYCPIREKCRADAAAQVKLGCSFHDLTCEEYLSKLFRDRL